MNDIDSKVDLTLLDPASEDPGYWERFQARTLSAAHPLLAERARRNAPNLGRQLVSWSRMVAPAAALAAAVAGMILLPAPSEMELASAPLLGLEDMLRHEIVMADLPGAFSVDEALGRDAFLLAVESGDGLEWR